MNIKILGIFAIATFFSTSSNAQKATNDLLKMNLNGKVKSIEEYRYEAVEKFGEITKKPRNKTTPDAIFVFDQQGNIIEQLQFGDYAQYSKTFQYDKNGNLIEVNSYIDNKLSGKALNKFDTNGDFSISTNYHGDGSLLSKEVYKFDNNGLKTVASYNSSGMLKGITSSSYINGNRIASWEYDADRNLKEKRVYKYDEKGNILEFFLYHSDATLQFKITYRYDEYGNVAEENRYDSDGNRNLRQLYEYRLDTRNNWIKQLFISNSVPQTFIERKIQYYD